MNQEKIGKFIAELRKEKKLTQEELANKLGITKNAVSKWERGLSMMDVSLFKPVCEILEVTIVELLNGERIKQDDMKIKVDDTIRNTIEYTNKKIKNNKVKNVLLTILIIAILCIGTFSIIWDFSFVNDILLIDNLFLEFLFESLGEFNWLFIIDICFL